MPPKRGPKKTEEADQWAPAAVKSVPQFIAHALGTPHREGNRERFPEVLVVYQTPTSPKSPPAKPGFQIQVGHYLMAPQKAPSGGRRAPFVVGEVRGIFRGADGTLLVQLRRFKRPEELLTKKGGAGPADGLPPGSLVRTGELIELSLALVAAGRRVEVLSAERLREDAQRGPVAGLGDHVFCCANELIFTPGGAMQMLWPLKAEDLAAAPAAPALQDGYAPAPTTPALRAEAPLPETSQKTARRRGKSPPEGVSPPKRARLQQLEEAQPPAKRPYSGGILGVLEKAADALRPCAGGSLVCRDSERKEIITRLRGAIREGGSTQILYASGMPGTGKTASIMEALKRLRGERETPDFASVEINAMRLGAPNAVFAEIRRQLRQQGMLPQASGGAAALAYDEVKEFFMHRPGGKVVLLFIDEIDQLATHRQAVLYCLFNLLLLPHPGLVVAAISNTLDLPERLLPRITSRVRCARVDFYPYTKSQIRMILEHRLKAGGALEAFTKDALTLCAMNIESRSGDIRKALQVCRHVVNTRLQETETPSPVEAKHLQVAVKELLRAVPMSEALGELSDRTRVLLVAAVVEQRRRPAEPVSLHHIASRYARLLFRYREEAVAETPEEARNIASRLEAMAILTLVPAAQAVSALGAEKAAHGPLYGFHGGIDEEDTAKILSMSFGEEDQLAEALQKS